MHLRTFVRVPGRILALATLLSLLLSAPTFAQTQTINLAWDPSPGDDIDHYTVYVGTAPWAQDAGVYTVPGSETSYAFAAMPGVLYYFTVSAANAAGEGSRSAPVSGSIPLISPVGNRASTVDVPIVPVRLSADDPDGGVLRFTHTDLPPGLVLDSNSGVITGIPVLTGTFPVTVYASDGVLTGSRSFDWTVQRPGSGDTLAPSLSITSPAPGQSVISSSVTVSGTATDGGFGDSGIVRVTVNGQLASGGLASGTGIANWSRTLTLSGTSSTIIVEALDGTGNYAAELMTLTRDVTAPSIAITSHASGQTVNSNIITLSGTATDSGSGGNGISRITVGSATATGGIATANNTANWSQVVTLSSGLNDLSVVAIDGAGNARTESITIRFTPLQLAVTSLTSSLASPQAPSTSIRFTAVASGGTAPYQFKWWVLSGGEWFVAQNWSSSTTFNWQPTEIGTYVVAVWVRNAGVTADASQALAQVPYVISTGVSAGSSSGGTAPLSITSLTSDQSSPRAAGTRINFTASAAGGTAPYQFKWWVLSGGAWYVAREWSSSPTLAWQPTTAGSYMVAVWGRNAGVTADASQALAQVPYVISPADGSSGSSSTGSSSNAALSLTGLWSNLASPQVPGAVITFTTAATGGSAPYQFKWWVQSGGTWFVAQDWNTSTFFTWRPPSTGSYVVAVWARNAGVTVDASQALAQTTYYVTSNGLMPLSVTSLLSNVSSPRSTGTTVTFTASASGGTAPYQFKWWVYDGSVWSVAQNWSTTANLSWRPTTPGSFVVAVWARNAGVTVDASEALAQVPFVISP